ncbi:MAG TPA: translocation/assembly module TamB domain-containing protein [Candidatus Baltobacteraceae bacterium]|nr:translocation/assembly module TamB domain-containing protein [Candidatus Baltobacteraceae bacterium]
MRKRLGAALAAFVAIVFAVLAVFHNGAARFALSAALPLATGYSIQSSDFRLERSHGALVDVHISRGGEPVLDARRIDLYYSLRDLFPGSRHRFGLTGITIDRPQITIVHHENGTYNVSVPGGVNKPAGPARRNNVPLNLRVRVRDASVALIDEYRFYKGSRRQRLDGISVDAAIDTAAITSYVVQGRLQDGGPQPFRIAGRVDNQAGFALHHVSVRSIPISTIGNYFINSAAAHILAGSVRDFDMRAWSWGPGGSHLAGAGKLVDGKMIVASLDAPIAHINGPIGVFDSGFAAQRMTARVGHIPIVFSGGIFDFANPQFRLGVTGSGDLRYLKEVAHFASGMPIYGGVRIHALIEGDIGAPILMIGFDGQRFNYQQVPIDLPHGTVALFNGNLVVLPFHAYYDGIKLHLEGILRLGRTVDSVLALHAVGPSSKIPYLSGMLAPQPVLTEVLLAGSDLKIDARGYLVSLRDAGNASGFYSIDRYGSGAFGPIALRGPDGGSLVADFALDRPHGTSAFWASVRGMRIDQPAPVGLPGVQIPQLPAMDARVVRADLAGTGSARNVVIGGAALMSPARIAGVPFNTIDAHFAGPFAAARISSVHADGPWGTFNGNGTFAPDVIVARGRYSGSFSGLRMFLGNFPVTGAIDGTMGIAIAQNRIFVQAQDARLQGATMHGIPVQSASGTMAYDNGVLRVYSAQARAAGGTVVAAGSFATAPTAQHLRLALATSTLDAGTLRDAFGVPISRGSLRAIGALMPGTSIPGVDAGMVLVNGSAAGYGPFQTSGEIAIGGDRLTIRNTVARLGTTIARVGGSMDALSSGIPRFDVSADVPAGEIAPMAALARVPTFNADGSFAGHVRIGGTPADPSIHGVVRVPVGEVNGLGFRDAQARIAVSSLGASALGGIVTVGETTAHFSATVSKGETAFAMHSAHADLSDFNDYFNTGDTLAGTGALGISFSHFANLTYTSGDIDITGLRYKRLPIGDTDATWSGLRNMVHGSVRIGGENGQLNAVGTIGFAPTTQLAQLVEQSRYDINARLSDLNLGTWLPALGFPQLPVTGRIVGAAQIRGTYPHIAISGNAAIHRGTIGPLAIDEGDLTARTAPGDRIDVTSMHFSAAGLQASGTGTFGLTPVSPMQMQVHAVTSDLPRLVAQISKRRLDLTGRFETTLTLGGSFRSPTFEAGIDAAGVDAFGIAIPSMVGQIQLKQRNIVVRNAEFTFPKGTASIAGALPLQLQPFAIGPQSAPISMDLSAAGVDLSTFAPLLGNDTKISGAIGGHLGISGTVRDPRIVGQLAASNVSYVSAIETTPITKTVAQLTFEGTHATLDRLHAQLGTGTADASGSLSFGGGLGGGPLGYALTLQSRGAQISMPQFGAGTFDAALRLERAPGALAQLKGNATITDAVLPFNTFLQFGSSGGGASSGPPFNLGFDLGITAGRNVRVRGGGAGIFGLDISGAGNARLSGTLLHPTLAGQFNSAGGTLTYIDHAFRVQTGVVTFDPANGVIPTIFAIARTHVTNPDPNTARNPTGSADITVTVTGLVTSPKLSFQSNPPGYTDQQILALLLPLGGLVGPIQFTDTGVILPPGQLNGAPEAATGQILPNVLVRRENGTLTIGQEAFNILNAQFTTGLLAPLETALGSTLGLSDVNLTVDYTGNVGVNVRRVLGPNFYAIYGTTFNYPVRQTFGFDYQPNSFTSAQFTMFVQQGPTPLFLNPSATISTNVRVTAGQAVQGQSGFTFLYQRLF